MGGDAQLSNLQPALGNRGTAHEFDRHYTYINAWATRRILEQRPDRHVDIGSQLSFTAVLSAALPVTIIEYRILPITLSNLTIIQGDILALPLEDQETTSLSCLHVAEHIGLGRYGDPINPNGTRDACLELARVLAPNGDLYFGLPIGVPRVCFNAHRIHSADQIIYYFRELKLIEFSVVDDHGHYLENATLDALKSANYGCGFFHFRREK